MKKILFIVPVLVLSVIMGLFTSCHFAKSYNDGDTVAASVFEPEDTSTKVHGSDTLKKTNNPIIDSIGMYYVGTGSTKQFLQLVSYPSRRDTLVYGKTRHVKVKGSADFDNVVRVKFYLLNGKDSLVCSVEQVIKDK